MIPKIRICEIQTIVKRLLPECIDAKEIRAWAEFEDDAECPKMNLFVKYQVKGFPAETSHLESSCDYTDDNSVVFKMITDFVWYVSRESRDKLMRRFLATDTVAKDELLPQVEEKEVH